MFETIFVQPIFNLLFWLYTIFGDFGMAIIVFTILIRMLLWPLLRKQLHQSRKIQALQPEIKKLREKYKDDRQQQSVALMELYKEKEVNPVGPLGLLLVQLPILFGLFSALRALIDDPSRIVRLPYSFLQDNERVVEIHQGIVDKTNQAIQQLPADQQEDALRSLGAEGSVTLADLVNQDAATLTELFTETLTTTVDGATQILVQGPYFMKELFGIVDLTNPGFSSDGLVLPVLVIAVLAGVFQYIQTKQLQPATAKNAKSLREIMKESALTGKEPDQADISAALGKNMGLFFAPLIAIFSATAPAGLALYFATGGLVGLIQQRLVFNQDVEEMQEIADKATAKKPKKDSSTNKDSKKKPAKKSAKKRRKK